MVYFESKIIQCFTSLRQASSFVGCHDLNMAKEVVSEITRWDDFVPMARGRSVRDGALLC